MEAEVEEVDVEGDGSSTCICITAAAAILYCYYDIIFVCLSCFGFFVVKVYAINDNEAEAYYYKEKKLLSSTLLLRRLADLIGCFCRQGSFQ